MGYLWLIDTTARNNIINTNIDVQYGYSLYWIFITAATIGYGDITPKNAE
jgi:hypothetical protein